MKGLLEKKDDVWYIKWYDTISAINGPEWIWTQLHPDDVNDIHEQSLVFDNIEARIASYPDVDFNLYEKWEEVNEQTKITTYAKIKKLVDENNYPLIDGTIALCNEIINKSKKDKQ